MAVTVWMLAGVSSTIRMRSFMSGSSHPVNGRGALEQCLRVPEGVALDVSLEFGQAVASEEESERLSIVLEEVGHRWIELGEVLAHLGDERLEGRRVHGRDWRRSGDGRLFAQQGTQAP